MESRLRSREAVAGAPAGERGGRHAGEGHLGDGHRGHRAAGARRGARRTPHGRTSPKHAAGDSSSAQTFT